MCSPCPSLRLMYFRIVNWIRPSSPALGRPFSPFHFLLLFHEYVYPFLASRRRNETHIMLGLSVAKTTPHSKSNMYQHINTSRTDSDMSSHYVLVNQLIIPGRQQYVLPEHNAIA